MGLDGVEIVMKVEEAFNITIDDAEAGRTATPGQLVDLVLSKVGRTVDEGCLTQRAFHRVRLSLMRYFRIQRNEIKPDTSLGNLFPRSTRKEDVRLVWKEIGISKEIELARPVWLMGPILTAIFGGGVYIAFSIASHPLYSSNPFLNVLVWPLPLVAAALFTYAFGWLAFRATSPMQIEFTPSVETVGQLSRWIVANAPDVVSAKPGQWSREQVSEIVRQIVLSVLGCVKEYREDAHFVKDLGMG